MARKDLDFDFAEEAQRAFSFLEAYGFSCVSTSSSKVRYESAKVRVDVCYGKRDGEVSIAFGRIAKKEEFSFTLFLRLVNSQLEKDLGERLADNREQLHECLDRLSESLGREGRAILQGDELVFERMKSVRWWDFEPGALKDGPHS